MIVARKRATIGLKRLTCSPYSLVRGFGSKNAAGSGSLFGACPVIGYGIPVAMPTFRY
jgi:hypothetical protein